MKTLSFDEMQAVNGGSAAGVACGALMGAWGAVLAYGMAGAALTAGLSAGVTAVYSLITIGLCEVVGNA